MRLSVAADKSPPVHCQHYRQLLQTDVVDRLVVSPLQEGRINAPRPASCLPPQDLLQTSGHALPQFPRQRTGPGNTSAKRFSPVPSAMAAVIAATLLVMPGNITDHLGEHICIAVLGRSSPGGLRSLCQKARFHENAPDSSLQAHILFLFSSVTWTSTAWSTRFASFNALYKFFHIMPVNRSQISDPHILKKHTRYNELFDATLCLFHLVDNFLALNRNLSKAYLPRLFSDPA